MFTLYNRWKAWLDGLNRIHARLDYFLRTYRPLRGSPVDVRLLIARCLADPPDGQEEQQNRREAAP